MLPNKAKIFNKHSCLSKMDEEHLQVLKHYQLGRNIHITAMLPELS